MAHNIFGERFYGHREKAWHGLGLVTQESMSGVEALTALGGGFFFEKMPNFTFVDGEYIPTGDFVIVRSETPDDPQKRFFGHVTDNYQIIQPLEIMEMFDEFVAQPVETTGMLGKGERMFLTWQLEGFSVLGNDPIDAYAFLAIGYDGKYAINLNVVGTRVVCQNTFSLAQSEAERNSKNKSNSLGRIWSGKHNSKNIHRNLGLWMEHVQEQTKVDTQNMQHQFETLARTDVSKDEVYNLLFGIYPDKKINIERIPMKLRAEKLEAVEKHNEYAERDRSLAMDLFEGAGTAIEGKTLWDAFNAVTEYENWGRMTKKPANSSILMGNRHNTMNNAMHLMYEYAVKE